MVKKLFLLLLIFSVSLTSFSLAIAADGTINRHVYTGHEYDANTGLIYFGARYYDPETGRFITQDSYLGNINDPPSLNRYIYAHSNPTIYVDPTGHYVESPWDLASLGIGGASLLYNVKTGAWGDAGLDAVGVVADTAALALPGVPGGAGMAIKAGRLAKASAKAVETVNSTKAIKYASEAMQSSQTLQAGISAVRAADSAVNAVQGVEAGSRAVEDIRQGQYAQGIVDAGAATLQVAHIAARAKADIGPWLTVEEGSGRMPLYASKADFAFESAAERLPEAAKSTSTRFINGVKVTDRATGNVLEGTVDLKPTLDRIASGQKFPHRNDGSIFRNDQGLLPKQVQGYYREFVHPTPGVSGSGPQRIITGQGGELYYTPDHYKTFVPFKP